MNSYQELKGRHQEEVNAFPMWFAFSDEQFERGMREHGLEPSDTDKIYKLGSTGGFYKRSDAAALKEMFDRHRAEMDNAIEGDKTGKGFVKEMFRYELGNHEYVITGDPEDAFLALGLSVDEVMSSPTLKAGYLAARKEYLSYCYEHDII